MTKCNEKGLYQSIYEHDACNANEAADDDTDGKHAEPSLQCADEDVGIKTVPMGSPADGSRLLMLFQYGEAV